MVLYLPGLDSDTVHCVVHHDISHSYVRDTCFCIVFSKPPDAYPMPRPTVHIVYVHVCTASLYRHAVIACSDVEGAYVRYED